MACPMFCTGEIVFAPVAATSCAAFWPRTLESLLQHREAALFVLQPQPPSRLLLLRNLQPFAAPDALYPVLARLPACLVQLGGDPPMPVAAVPAGQCDDGPGQRVFVFPLYRLGALRAAWMRPDQLYSSPFTDEFSAGPNAVFTENRELQGLLEVLSAVRANATGPGIAREEGP